MCDEVKPATEFYVCRREPDRKQRRCKPCDRQRQREYRAGKAADINARRRWRNAERRENDRVFAEAERARARVYYTEHREHILERERAYRFKNRPAILAKQREQRAKRRKRNAVLRRVAETRGEAHRSVI
jgi:hypothetical protein